ncbi:MULTISPECIES: efflux RND transporter periplasmic adaptor subunit [Flavobacterium]|uniref:HlyD family efflux transporter periplasmic adaptor subunit n=1 Tax=Flavobacterium panici TaxID=2654843 RepID=A0A9N8P2V5_9FLAO|nr:MULTISPECIES: HlyD family efflux transporter periplasmic adaptor subunit [Flavobacterium]UUF16697.1 HlyD family efflux transporter periplasmic adaptor subunit [Flavobacterium panici]CAC9975497.1 HlyD family efflux transporter periplasmic adaptor subunit [Flavobacterium panici]
MDIRIEKKKGLKLKHVGYAVLTIVVIAVVFKVFLSDSLGTYDIEKNKLSIAQVTQGKFDDYITINGNIAPISTIYLDAYEGGRVKEKLVEEGNMVKKGDVILKLENLDLYEQILTSESNLALKQNDLRSTKLAFDTRQLTDQKDLVNSQYDLQKLKRNYEQNESLYKEKLISKEEYLLSKEKYNLTKEQYVINKTQADSDSKLRNTSFKSLDADLVRMKKILNMVYQRLDHLNVKAIADGQLGLLNAEVGQNISPGDRIGQINVLTNYKIEATIDEHYIDRVKNDLSASLQRNNTEYPLRIQKVYPEVRDGKFKIDLVFVGGKPENIRTGQSYNIKLQLGESKKGILLPKGSFFNSTGGQWVFVVDNKTEQALKRPIRIGRQNSKYYEILEGLNGGENVIISGYEGFKEVDKIILN